MTVRKKRKTAKEKKNSASTIDVLMPPDTKMIIEIPDLILDENFNESASEEFDSNSSTELKLNLSHEETDRIINQRSLNDIV